MKVTGRLKDKKINMKLHFSFEGLTDEDLVKISKWLNNCPTKEKRK